MVELSSNKRFRGYYFVVQQQIAYGQRYPDIGAIWDRAWGQVVPFFNFGSEVRRLIYTADCIEALNRSIRKVIKTRSLFPNEDAAKKLIAGYKEFDQGME